MPATLVDKVLVLPQAGLLLSKVALAAVTGPFRGSEGAPTYFEHVMNTLVRGMLNIFSIEQLQWIAPAFVDTYKSWCTKNNVKPDIVDIPNTASGTQGFWIGSKSTAKYTMIYYHGGGFVFSGSPMHLDMLLRFVQWSNNNLAVFCVAYTLSPAGVYPSAIGQSVAGLQYVLDQPGHKPSRTLLGGDSAGGNLVLAVLSHLAHPHPKSDIVKPVAINEALKGAIVIAPWTSSDNTKYPSMDKFSNRDIVNTYCANYWINAYKGPGNTIADDEYIYAATASPDWWKSVGEKTGQILALAGEEEGLVDAITDWVKTYKEANGEESVRYVVGKREIHVPTLNPLGEERLERTGEDTQEGAIRLWIKKNLAA